MHTEDNPADDASRGLSTSDTEKVHRWFHGRQKLREANCDSVDVVSAEIPDNDPEVVVEVKCNSVLLCEDSHLIVNSLGERVSSWIRMIRLMRALIRFVRICYSKMKHSSKVEDSKVEDLVHAGEQLLRLVQAKHFLADVKALRGVKEVTKSSRMKKLSPFLDGKGVMRVRGRLRKAQVSDTAKHPVILPTKEVIVTRIIEWCHMEVEHLGRTTTLGEIRSRGFWILSAHEQVRRVVYKCVPCRILRGMPEKQRMGELPESRSSDAPPFTYCGVDLFGPFVVKERRSEVKRYGVIFTCFGCRAIHLETTTSMDTDTFIFALRRFIGRRGPVRSIRSDNGGNFVGADNEMRKAISEFDQQKIKDFLLTEHCDWEWVDWSFNPPLSSNMGGVWERLIRSVRSILSSLLKKQASRLNDESLRTLLVEVEAIVNSRPLINDPLSDKSV